MHKLKRHILILLLFLAPLAGLEAQWLQPHRIHFGLSAGFGGLHEWGKPSFDIHWNRLTARVAPGLFYMSGGLTYQLAYFKPKQRTDRIIIINAYYHNDWFLSNLRNRDIKKDVNAVMIMPGFHVNLNHLGTYYLEISAGYTYAREANFTTDGNARVIRHHHLPMAEIRIGGVFLSRKEHHQEFKYYPRDAKKIKKKKLKFD